MLRLLQTDTDGIAVILLHEATGAFIEEKRLR